MGTDMQMQQKTTAILIQATTTLVESGTGELSSASGSPVAAATCWGGWRVSSARGISTTNVITPISDRASRHPTAPISRAAP